MGKKSKPQDNVDTLQEPDRRSQLDDMRAVLATVAGRRVFNRILARAHVYSTTFTGNSSSFFNEGMRSLGLQILADIQVADFESYLKMLRENHNEVINDSRNDNRGAD
jgi:hypothetical protein